MSISVCPVATVAAPVEDVWELLTHPSRYDEWVDAHFERSVPEGPMVAGQIVYLWSSEFGKRFDISFVIKKVDPDKHLLQLDAMLPFGVVNHETITCISLDGNACRVQFG